MVAASSAVERLAETDTLPVPSTRSENMSEVRVRLSPLASVRTERRVRICVAGFERQRHRRSLLGSQFRRRDGIAAHLHGTRGFYADGIVAGRAFDIVE